MASLRDAEQLARELNSQATPHPRVSMFLVPQAEVHDHELVITFYWYDRNTSEAHDTLVPFADYATQPIAQAATQILHELTDDTPAS
jgi:hypothetical protein